MNYCRNEIKDMIIGCCCILLHSLENTLSWVGLVGQPGLNVKPLYRRILTEIQGIRQTRSLLLDVKQTSITCGL